MPDLLEKLTLLAEQADREFDDSSYGQSVCRLHKQGQVNNRLKYCEGRDFVARTILKMAQKGQTPEQLRRALDELEGKNTSIKNSLILTSSDWQVYADGALSMIEEIFELMSEGSGS